MSVERPKALIGDTAEFIEKTGGYLIAPFMGEQHGHPELKFGNVEVAVMELGLEDNSPPHYHLKSRELTYVLSGCLTLIINQEREREVQLRAGEFIVVEPGTVLQNPKNEPGTRVLVVKSPSVPGDKYYVE